MNKKRHSLTVSSRRGDGHKTMTKGTGQLPPPAQSEGMPKPTTEAAGMPPAPSMGMQRATGQAVSMPSAPSPEMPGPVRQGARMPTVTSAGMLKPAEQIANMRQKQSAGKASETRTTPPKNFYPGRFQVPSATGE
jgi:hypothetical protein